LGGDNYGLIVGFNELVVYSSLRDIDLPVGFLLLLILFHLFFFKEYLGWLWWRLDLLVHLRLLFFDFCNLLLLFLCSFPSLGSLFYLAFRWIIGFFFVGLELNIFNAIIVIIFMMILIDLDLVALLYGC
jgi:hypothetical protein